MLVARSDRFNCSDNVAFYVKFDLALVARSDRFKVL